MSSAGYAAGEGCQSGVWTGVRLRRLLGTEGLAAQFGAQAGAHELQSGLGHFGIEPLDGKADRSREVPSVHSQLSDLPLCWHRRSPLELVPCVDEVIGVVAELWAPAVLEVRWLCRPVKPLVPHPGQEPRRGRNQVIDQR